MIKILKVVVVVVLSTVFLTSCSTSSESVANKFVSLYISNGSSYVYDQNREERNKLLSQDCKLNLTLPVVTLNQTAYIVTNKISTVEDKDKVTSVAEISSSNYGNQIVYFYFTMSKGKIKDAEIKLYTVYNTEKLPW